MLIWEKIFISISALFLLTTNTFVYAGLSIVEIKSLFLYISLPIFIITMGIFVKAVHTSIRNNKMISKITLLTFILNLIMFFGGLFVI